MNTIPVTLTVSQTDYQLTIGSSEDVTKTIGMDTAIQLVHGDTYEGDYTVTPTQETQLLQTEGLVMTQNLTVEPIPQCYGLITWDGSVLTVS